MPVSDLDIWTITMQSANAIDVARYLGDQIDRGLRFAETLFGPFQADPNAPKVAKGALWHLADDGIASFEVAPDGQRCLVSGFDEGGFTHLDKSAMLALAAEIAVLAERMEEETEVDD